MSAAGAAESAPTDVAIVGMAGRFPSAAGPDELWARVVAGDDCLSDVPRRPASAPGATAVARAGIVPGYDQFDPDFFGIGRRDAAVMDPQQRLFLECAWEALESAGHVPERFDGAIGVFAGAGANTYLLNNLLTNPDLLARMGWFLLRHTGNDKDFLSTTASYRLGLQGPSINVQTACSTSLVAVHLAVQSLLGFETDLALAGGVTLEVPHGVGYEAREGEILSPTGRCRAFDAASDGTVLTGGAAVVAVRRLDDALRDGDPVLAVIKGSAVNNDGARKAGYLAPSVDGHADVIREALIVADVHPDTIELFEAHGTGTAIGDPIEFAAVSAAYAEATRVGHCRIVSSKPNIGHLDTAAGTASLIKTVQALRHRVKPPLANHTAPSPLLDLAGSPFEISGVPVPWESTGPRRAGVSSLGVGGTNAHVIVEEAPPEAPRAASHDAQLLALSGGSPEALDAATERLAEHLTAHSPDLSDVAHTLLVGRRWLSHRRVVVAVPGGDAPATLRAALGRGRPAIAAGTSPRVIFGFPGGGAQYPGMGSALDGRFATFHAVRDEIVGHARASGCDLAPLLSPEAAAADLERPTASLPLVFATSVALARQWMDWGVEPALMIGHSLGEYAAAHLAGVFSLADATRLVVARSALMERASGDAAMLVVGLAADQVTDVLPADLSLAVISADDECVVAGRAPAIERFTARLNADGVDCTRIPLAAAAHSALLDPVLDEFRDVVRTAELKPPDRPYLSNLTGELITDAEATDPDYWVAHLRGTVQFARGLHRVAAELDGADAVFLELGPGRTLGSYVRRAGVTRRTVATLRHPEDSTDDTAYTLGAFGDLWAHGADVDLGQFVPAGRRKVVLPTYPFQRERYWIDPGPGFAGLAPAAVAGEGTISRIDELDAMAFVPVWGPAPTPVPAGEIDDWVVLGDGSTAVALAESLRRSGATVTLTAPAVGVDPAFDWPVVAARGVVLVDDGSRFDAASELWLRVAPRAVRALAESVTERSRFVAVTRGAVDPAGGAAAHPSSALAFGVTLVAPREYPGLSGTVIDLAPDQDTTDAALVDAVRGGAGLLAIRDGALLAAHHQPQRVDAPEPGTEAPGAGGTYVITGGLGRIGSELALRLAERPGTRLALITSRALPDRADRPAFLRSHGLDHPVSQQLRRLAEIERLAPGTLVVTTDLGDPVATAAALDEIEAALGPIGAVVHAAGQLRDRPIATATDDDFTSVVTPKARAAVVLADELERRGVPRLLLVASTSTILAPEGQAAYVAANAVLDALAGRSGPLLIQSLAFGMWADLGMAADAARRLRLGLPEGTPIDHPVLDRVAIDHRGRTIVWGRLSAHDHWVVDEHRTLDGRAILPGTGQLELLVAAVRAAGLDGAELRDVALLLPVVVPDDGSVTVRVVIEPGHDGPRTIRLDSDAGTGAGWVAHTEGHVVVGAPSPSLPAVDDLAAPDPDFAPLVSARGRLRLGPHWDAPVVGSARHGTAQATIELADPSEATAWTAHPATVDIVTGIAAGLADQPEAALYAPTRYDRVTWTDHVPPSARARVTRRDASADGLVADVVLAGADGQPTLAIEGLHLTVLASGAELAPDLSAAVVANEHPSGLLGTAAELGLHADEGIAWLLRTLAADVARVMVTSVAPEDLLRTLAPAPPEPTVSPATAPSDAASSIEATLIELWSGLLGVADIGPDDDFFDLGGHSLIAIRLMTAIRSTFGVRLELASIFDAPTVSGLAAAIRAERPDAETAESGGAGPARRVSTGRQLVTISDVGERRPLFVVHGAGGNVLFLWSLARALRGERPIYGFQARGVNHDELPDPSAEAMAERYVAELRANHPGPYLLGGYSGGGVVALEMVNQLQALGETVDHVLLFDSVPSHIGPISRPTVWANTARHAMRRGVGSVKPFVRQRIVEAVRRFVPEKRERVIEHQNNDRALGYADVDQLGYVNPYFYVSAALEEYRTGEYHVDATVLTADLVWPALPADYYWTPHIKGRLEFRTVPGDHNTMFYPEYAPSLGRVVSDVLRRYDGPDAT